MESMNDEDAADFIGCEEDQASVRVASLEKLVDYCAEEFSGDVPEPILSNSVFMTYKWFISSEELLRKFMQRYSNNSVLNNEHIRKFKRSICSAVGFWISRYGSDFKKDEQLTLLLNEFREKLECEEEKEIIHLSNTYAEEMRNRALSALTSAEHTPLDHRKSSLAFKDISANTIAEQLTYLEYRMLRRIPFSEWKTYVCTGKLKETTYLERYVALFNGVSRWVQGMVLNCVTPQERACCMEKFQQTAKHLKELQNFNGLMAVAGALTNSVLSRLRQTQELLTQDCQEFLKMLMEFLSSNGNYASYRKTLNNCTGFHIPIL
ncbi:RAS guanyl releasing protein 1 (calcium and DAG-regulated) [Desmophyllum pertusum]|uniref:RAS guanyl releasing protein 1 (Calcium and DAG-regulated) n=1 Tax=Desmophyllum pertusum TaxID=174260 RepID=A0A9W9Z0S9_9CNID|nr:RAS guanyl releasing protein 1 (calcium and DAG-regulated) [Desmophyllum pertusum]